ncbi:MAG: hypothetical protein MEQ84_14285, partial [Mesorhizobium sp.]|nr:hypothetical protein [Mesorhizobium sp.]
MNPEAPIDPPPHDSKPDVDPEEMAERQPAAPSGQDEIRIVGEPPRVMRLSRKALATLGLVASIGIGGSLIFALQPKDDAPPENLIDTDSRNRAEQVTGAPSSYSDVPRPGPPLPEDLR